MSIIAVSLMASSAMITIGLLLLVIGGGVLLLGASLFKFSPSKKKAPKAEDFYDDFDDFESFTSEAADIDTYEAEDVKTEPERDYTAYDNNAKTGDELDTGEYDKIDVPQEQEEPEELAADTDEATKDEEPPAPVHIAPRMRKSNDWQYAKLTATSFSVKGAGLRQQDSYRLPPSNLEDVLEDKGALFILCDGLGSPTDGAIASNGCSNALSDAFYSIDTIKSTPHFLHDILPMLDNHVQKMVQSDSPTGTTVVCAVIKNDELYLGSVGNSRLYVIRDESMYQITKDHTYYQQLESQVMEGSLTLEQAKNHPKKDELTSYLGIGDLKIMQVNSQPVGLTSKDKVLMCSEGVYKQLTDDSIKNIITESESISRAMISLQEAIEDIPEDIRIDSTAILIGYGL